jgi:hypothetical protein
MHCCHAAYIAQYQAKTPSSSRQTRGGDDSVANLSSSKKPNKQAVQEKEDFEIHIESGWLRSE